MPVTDGGRASLVRRLRAAATERLALKGAALFFACVLWLVVSAEEPTEQVVEVVVAPRLDSSMALVGRRPVVRALVVGRARDLLELAGDPPVARPTVLAVDRDSARVTILPGDIELPTNARVLVREVRPRTLVLQLARVARPVPPASPAESALAGLVPARVRADSAQIEQDSLLLDTLAPLDTIDTTATVPAGTLAPRPMRRDSLRLAPPSRRDSVRRDSARRDSVRRDSARRDSARREPARRP